MEYYLTLNKSGIRSFAGKWKELEIMISERQISHVLSHMQNSGLKNKKE
jgi:hypothetical protein